MDSDANFKLSVASERKTAIEANLDRIAELEFVVLKLRKALVGLVGEDDPDALRGMKSLLSSYPVDEADSVNMLFAMQVLIDTQEYK